jgi:hypothetical protein
MAREYPRFLFSNPQNTKSKGPFVIHCLQPRLIFKVHPADLSDYDHERIREKHWIMRWSTGSVFLELLDETPKSDKGRLAMMDATEWIHNQIYQGVISI